jgi:hypothetical protein
MANTLGPYDPLFYAQEGLAALRQNLRWANRVYRGLDRSPQDKGSIIQITRPATFVAQDAPSTAQDINVSSIDVRLDQWKEVKFALTDKELTFTKEKIIEDHIGPAGYALALDIDTKLASMAAEVPWFIDVTNPAGVADITAARRNLLQRGVPTDRLNMIIDPQLESEFLNLTAFSQAQGAADTGVATQRTGSLGVKFGFEIAGSNNVRTHVAGVAADSVGALVGAHAAGATVIAFNGVTAAGTFKRGDTFVIAGHTQRYALLNDVTADGTGAVTGAQVSPALAAGYAGGAVVTFSLMNHVQNLAFHRDFAALAMAPLTTIGRELMGARIETVVDEESGIALRARMFYVGDQSKVYVALDVLYGYRVLNPNMAVVLRD